MVSRYCSYRGLFREFRHVSIVAPRQCVSLSTGLPGPRPTLAFIIYSAQPQVMFADSSLCLQPFSSRERENPGNSAHESKAPLQSLHSTRRVRATLTYDSDLQQCSLLVQATNSSLYLSRGRSARAAVLTEEVFPIQSSIRLVPQRSVRCLR